MRPRRRRRQVALFLLAAGCIAVGCRARTTLPFGTDTGTVASGPEIVRVRAELARAEISWEPIAGADSYVLYVANTTAQVLTRANYGSLAGSRTPAVTSPVEVPLPADRTSQVLVTAVAAGLEGTGSEPVWARAIAIGTGGLVPSRTHTSLVGGANERFGAALASADLDGDGLSDLLVGEPGKGISDVGSVAILYGSTNGILAVAQPTQIPDPDNGANAKFGAAVAATNDAPGSFLVAIGAPDAGTVIGAGRAYLYDSFPPPVQTPVPQATPTGASGDNVGDALAVCDVDGDHRADALVGSPGSGGNGNGQALLFLQQSGGGFQASKTFEDSNTLAGDRFGDSLACLPDPASASNRVLAFGAPSYDDNGVANVGLVDWNHASDAGVSYLDSGTQAGTALATSIADAGDVDGDGVHELVIGAPGANGNVGEAKLVTGVPGGAGAMITPFVDGTVAGGLIGTSVAGVDVNGDGYSDVLVGAPGIVAADSNSGSGEVLLFLGGPDGLSTTPRAVIVGTASSVGFGTSLAVLRDANGDGAGDFAIGDPDWSNGAGAAFVFYGPPTTGPSVSLGTSRIGGVAGTLVTLPIEASDPSRDAQLLCRVDWGDGVVVGTVCSGAATHTYATAGRYVIGVLVRNATYDTESRAITAAIITSP